MALVLNATTKAIVQVKSLCQNNCLDFDFAIVDLIRLGKRPLVLIGLNLSLNRNTAASYLQCKSSPLPRKSIFTLPVSDIVLIRRFRVYYLSGCSFSTSTLCYSVITQCQTTVYLGMPEHPEGSKLRGDNGEIAQKPSPAQTRRECLPGCRLFARENLSEGSQAENSSLDSEFRVVCFSTLLPGKQLLGSVASLSYPVSHWVSDMTR